jgi:hypothetical protein
MERRDFLKIAFGVAAGAVVTAGAAQAMPPVAPAPAGGPLPETEAKPAVTTAQDVEQVKSENVHWRHRHRRRHWRRHSRWHRSRN